MEIVPKGSNRSPVPEKRAKRTDDPEELCWQCQKAFGWVISTLTENPDSRREKRRLGCEELSDHIGPDVTGRIKHEITDYERRLRPRQLCATCHLQPTEGGAYKYCKLYVEDGARTNFRKAKDGSAFNKIGLLWISEESLTVQRYFYTIVYKHEPQHEVKSLQMSSSWIDYDWLRETLDHCVLKHRKCHSSGGSITKLRLIDVEGEGRLEDFEQGQAIDYIALSYVWGTSSRETGDRKNFEPEPLIKDAMIVTKRLGYKYLWVDRYVRVVGPDLGSPISSSAGETHS